MMKKNKIFKGISLFILIAVCFVSLPNISNAEENPMQAYEQKLVEINERLGTSYKIASEQELEGTEITYNELVAFYSEMSLAEFEEYILELHSQNNQAEYLDSRIEYDNTTTNGLSRSASTNKQYFYYQSGSSNYIALTTYNIIIGGTSYYQSVYSYSWSQAYSYPYYKPTSISYTPSSDSRQLTCTFTCTKYISATVIQTTTNQLVTTFTAQGGGSISSYNFSTSATVLGSGIRLRNYPNMSSSVLELMYAPENVYVDLANSTMTFYCVKRKSSGTIGYASKDYVSVTQLANE